MKHFLRNDHQGFLTLYALFLLSIFLMAGSLLAQKAAALYTFHQVSYADLSALYKIKAFVRHYERAEEKEEEELLPEEGEPAAFDDEESGEEEALVTVMEAYTYDGYDIEIRYEKEHACCTFSSPVHSFLMLVSYDLEEKRILSYSYE